MEHYGANIERGRVTAICEDGYRVDSYTRPGILTPPLPSLNGAAYSVGDRVYFFVFEDGHGLIIAAF